MGFLTRFSSRTNVQNTRSSGERIAVVSFQTGASSAVRCDDALGVLSAKNTVAGRNASSCSAFLKTGQAATPSGVILRLTIGIDATWERLAWIDTATLDAGQLSVTIRVGRALGTRLALASVLIGVADET